MEDLDLLRRAKYSLKHEGLRNTLLKLPPLIADYLFDFKYGVDTCKAVHLHELTIKSNNKDRGNFYKATRVLPLRKLFQIISNKIPSDRIFVDFGCGKGRALLIASEYDFKKVRGVEFAEELSKIANDNIAKYKTKTGTATEFKIICSDASLYKIKPDENVFFIFNSFDEVVLQKVLENIAESLKAYRRNILIVYYNPCHSSIVEQQPFIKESERLSLYTDEVVIYSN